MTTPRYTLEEVQTLKAALTPMLEAVEAEPITVDGQTGPLSFKDFYTQYSATVAIRWKPKLPILGPGGVREFAEVATRPMLVWQLLDQLEDLLAERAEVEVAP